MRAFIMLLLIPTLSACTDTQNDIIGLQSIEATIEIIAQYATDHHSNPKNHLRWGASGEPDVILVIPYIGVYQTNSKLPAQENKTIGTIQYPIIKSRSQNTINGRLIAIWGAYRKEISVEIKTNE